MSNKRWKLKISFNGYSWALTEDYKQLTTCLKEADELKDSTVKSMAVEDKVTGRLIFI